MKIIDYLFYNSTFCLLKLHMKGKTKEKYIAHLNY